MHIAWPPPYSLKINPRAKYLNLRISQRTGLQVTVPKAFKQSLINQVLEEKKLWILKHLAAIKPKEEELPKQIQLLAIKETWNIQYYDCNAPLKLYYRPNFELAFMGKLDFNNVIKTQKLWIKNYAKQHLPSMLKNLSEQLELPYKKVTIKDQISRWGSCSSKNRINLNYKLLFLPLYLVKYVLIHELCHTIHLNHSERFWTLLKNFDPQCLAHRKELKKANQWIPSWLF